MIEANPFGPLITPENVIFRLWAPGADRVELLHDKTHEMRRTDDGWFKLTIPGARPGDRYRFRIDGETEVPDPASRFQPEDVHGPSEVIDQTYAWQTTGWIGRPWHECVFLELHVGTFTKDGTFRGVIDKLDRVLEAGFTAIELMPVADFFGRWNWGYDGVLLYAPDSAYGRPEDLKALVDAAHQRGLMVFLDVVYNHFGPEGNYLSGYAPQFFCKANTPWGNAIDYEVTEVRRFAVENALHWLSDFRLDGLRLDAVHAIPEPGRNVLLKELSESAGTLAAETGRHIHLVLENDANQASLLDPLTEPPHGKYRAQWNDDFHHALHVLLTGETAGYYGDYRDPPPHLARALGEGFAYQGEPSPHREGAARGEPTSALPATAFVNFLQNHDQIGNRARGERLSVLARPAALEAALAVTLLAPSPPLMFMGDEWGAREPFPFFCDFRGDLAEAVRRGRRQEFAEAYASGGHEVPDPLSEQTVRLAKLNWAAIERHEHQARLDLVRRLLAARKSFVISRLPLLQPGHAQAGVTDGVLTARWTFGSGETLSVLANLSEQARPRPDASGHGEPFWGGAPPASLPPWSVYAAIGD
ncbi:MAG: maltooligosyltrehalose trehalohydrolase [Alphaproteobacteria bacterium]|jgi:malto-oligosyltrehalose trehalohydrolase|nr:maltooligosyltrehalose trehalohydrolase [Alphaproteobacteria bacterium]